MKSNSPNASLDHTKVAKKYGTLSEHFKIGNTVVIVRLFFGQEIKNHDVIVVLFIFIAVQDGHDLAVILLIVV